MSTDPEPKKLQNVDALETHDDDQTRAAAHEFIDGAVAYVVLTIGKDGDVHRVRNATPGHAIMLVGSLEYQKAVFIKDLLDERDYNAESSEEDD